MCGELVYPAGTRACAPTHAITLFSITRAASWIGAPSPGIRRSVLMMMYTSFLSELPSSCPGLDLNLARRRLPHLHLDGLFFVLVTGHCCDGTTRRHLRISSNSTAALLQSPISSLSSRGSRSITHTMDAGLLPVSHSGLTQSSPNLLGGLLALDTESQIIFQSKVRLSSDVRRHG